MPSILFEERLAFFQAGLHVVPLHGGSFDTAATQAHWEAFQQGSKWLGRFAVLSLLILFLLIPTVWQLYGAESRVMLVSALGLPVVNYLRALVQSPPQVSYRGHMGSLAA